MTALTRSSLEYDADNRIDLAGIMRTAYDHKALIIAITGLFTVLGVLYALIATPIYQATAMIQIEPKKAAITGIPEISPRPDSVSQAVTEISLLKSRAVLGKAVEELKLYIVAKPRQFPLIGGYMARQHDPATDGALAKPLFGLTAFAWGGEKLDVFQLDVPEAYLGMDLTLVAGTAGNYSLYDDEEQLILRGQVNQAVETQGFKVQIAEL